ncbi:cell wall-active antibiotics response protein [bacterium]|nr:cell wall-active antibiotics response protein [bacterium]
MSRKLTSALVVVLALCVVIAYAKKRNSFAHTEALGGAEFVELQLDLSIAETSVKAGEDETLVDFSGEYDEDFDEPTMKVERETDMVYVYLESDDDHHHFGGTDDMDGGDYQVLLSPKPEYAIRCDVGLGENNIDLTGLKVKRLELDAGLAETELIVDKPNEIESDRISIECGLGSLETVKLGHLRFKKLDVDAGMGDVTLDLRGYKGEGMVDISVGMGSCDIIVEKGMGIRVYHDGGFLSSIDLDDMEKVRKDVWETDDYDTASIKLDIDLSVGMGDVDLRWR